MRWWGGFLILGGIGFIMQEFHWGNALGVIGGIFVLLGGIYVFLGPAPKFVSFSLLVFGVFLVNPNIFDKTEEKILERLDQEKIFEENKKIYVLVKLHVDQKSSKKSAEILATEKARETILDFKAGIKESNPYMRIKGKGDSRVVYLKNKITKIHIKDFEVIKTENLSSLNNQSKRDFFLYAKAEYEMQLEQNPNAEVIAILDQSNWFEKQNWIYLKTTVRVRLGLNPQEAESIAVKVAKRRILEIKGSSIANTKSLYTQTHERIGEGGTKEQTLLKEEHFTRKVVLKEFQTIETFYNPHTLKKNGRHSFSEFIIYVKARL